MFTIICPKTLGRFFFRLIEYVKKSNNLFTTKSNKNENYSLFIPQYRKKKTIEKFKVFEIQELKKSFPKTKSSNFIFYTIVTVPFTNHYLFYILAQHITLTTQISTLKIVIS